MLSVKLIKNIVVNFGLNIGKSILNFTSQNRSIFYLIKNYIMVLPLIDRIRVNIVFFQYSFQLLNIERFIFSCNQLNNDRLFVIDDNIFIESIFFFQKVLIRLLQSGISSDSVIHHWTIVIPNISRAS